MYFNYVTLVVDHLLDPGVGMVVTKPFLRVVLLISAFISAGMWFYLTRSADRASVNPAFEVIVSAAPLRTWAIGWALMALACLAAAFHRRPMFTRMVMSFFAGYCILFGLAAAASGEASAAFSNMLGIGLYAIVVAVVPYWEQIK